MTTPVFLFPGQSSRYPGMFERLFERAPEEARTAVGVASEVLGRDLRAHYHPSNEGAFLTNRDVQLAVFIANHIYKCALERAGVRADYSLGLSLGEYNHLVHIGAIDFDDAVELIDARGAAYDAGPEGVMVSVFPLPVDELEPVLAAARAHGPLFVANLNSPTQNVIAGSRAAVEAAVAALEEEHGCSCVLIEQRIPMHSPTFRPTADLFRPALERAPWRRPELPYLPNVIGRFEDDARPERIVEHLTRHVYSPVYWRASIDYVGELVPDAAFIEVGPRAVLYNLLSRSWRKNRRFKTDHGDEAPRPLTELAMELAHGA
ncbi:MAG: ACP S-malonyltransferase [Polyangiaceae bacterium]|nr:ACP S-malonyltransferase [Polyangiaceae bacterium]